MASVKLNLGEGSPNDIRLREVVDDTVKSAPSTTVYLYDATQQVESRSGEPALRLRLGETAPEDIRLYEAGDQRQSSRSVDIVLSDPTVLRSGGELAVRYCTLNVSEESDQAAIATEVIAAAELAVTEDPDTAAISAGAIVGVDLAATEAPDAAAFTAVAEPIVVRRRGGGGIRRVWALPAPLRMTLRATEAPDKVSGSAFVVPQIVLAASAKERPDALAFEIAEDFTDDELIMLLAA